MTLQAQAQGYDLGWLGDKASQPSMSSEKGLQNLGDLISSVDKPYFDDLWLQMAYEFDLQYPANHPRIRKIVREYKEQAYHFARVTERAEPFLYFIIDELRKRNMPLELALLPMVESSFELTAKSSSSAAGLWQFIPSTAQHFGLSNDAWYDARKDIYASTQAALDYLSQLHKRFGGDWLLALAAYNAGGGTVSRAIRYNQNRHRPTDYWSLDLSSETRRYVPKFLALVEVVKHAQEWNLPFHPIANAPSFGKFLLKEQLDLNWVAQASGLSFNKIKELNPAYKRNVTHPNEPHYLYLPQTSLTRLSLALDKKRFQQQAKWDIYEVKTGDTYWKIARAHQISVELLLSLNSQETADSGGLKPGQKLLIPKQKS
jgi:membrane-bound lytic murein transglycosylase D